MIDHAKLIDHNAIKAAANALFRLDADKTNPPDLLPFLHNDHGNACRLIAMFGEEFRFATPSGNTLFGTECAGPWMTPARHGVWRNRRCSNS